jgi:Flp pilus assembly protein TadB
MRWIFTRKFPSDTPDISAISAYGIYSIFIGVAFALYFVEVYFNSPLWQTIAGVVGIVLWFFVCWYFMKIYISKEQKNLNEMIEKLERLEKQFINEA